MNPAEASSIATLGDQAYGRLMVALRLVRFLTLVALLVAPLRMMSAHAEMAMPSLAASDHHPAASATSDHCGGSLDPSQPDRPASTIDCTIACSACPTVETATDLHPHAASGAPPAAALRALLGLHPESDPPPPRFA